MVACPELPICTSNREINMEFNARYIKDDDMPGRSGCSFVR